MEKNDYEITIKYYKEEILAYDRDIIELTEKLAEAKEARQQREDIMKILENKLNG